MQIRWSPRWPLCGGACPALSPWSCCTPLTSASWSGSWGASRASIRQTGAATPCTKPATRTKSRSSSGSGRSGQALSCGCRMVPRFTPLAFSPCLRFWGSSNFVAYDWQLAVCSPCGLVSPFPFISYPLCCLTVFCAIELAVWPSPEAECY